MGNPPFIQFVQRLGKRVKKRTAPDIGNHRHMAGIGRTLPAKVRKTGNQDRRQVIHTVIPHIFQLLHEIRFPRTAHARDNHKTKPFHYLYLQYIFLYGFCHAILIIRCRDEMGRRFCRFRRIFNGKRPISQIKHGNIIMPIPKSHQT